jgi:hypothetical protein
MTWSTKVIVLLFLSLFVSSPVLSQVSIQEKLKDTTRLYLTAGGKEYMPNEGTGVHSPFSYKLLESLRSYGGVDSVLSLTEIFNIMKGSWTHPATGTFGGNQEGSEFFFIAKHADRIPGAKNYALIVGTDQYENFEDLKNPTFDATSMARELYYYGFEPELLLNPTQEEILNMVVQFTIKKYGPNDQLVLYLSGHGTKGAEPMSGKVICRDTAEDDPNYSTSLPHDAFMEVIDHIPCKHILVILDSAGF